MKITAIIPAAGTGSRYSNKKNKLLENLKGIPVIIHTLRVISSVDEITEIIICTSMDLQDQIHNLIREYNIPKTKKIILGGQTRQQSVFNGLREIKNTGEFNLVLIHDGARPLVSQEIIRESISTALKKGAAIAAVPAKDTIKKINPDTGEVIETVDRQSLWNVQTPQVFRLNDIFGVHQAFKGDNMTDDSALMEKAGYKVYVCMGSYKNLKITTEEDLKIAEGFIG